MVIVYVNGTDRSRVVQHGSIQIDEALTSQPDTCRFVMENVRPTAGQEVIMWDGAALTAAVTAGSNVTIPLTSGFTATGKFRVGDVLTLGVEDADQEDVTVTAVGTSSVTVSSVASSHSAGEVLARKIFGGIILSVRSVEESHNTSYVLWEVECGDYQTLLERKLINDVYLAQKPHAILADILNTVNSTEELDGFEYATNGALQAVWTAAFDASSRTTGTDAAVGSYAATFGWTYSVGAASFIANGTLTSSDVSTYTGVASGTPTGGKMTFRLECEDASKITTLKIGIGSDGSNYAEYTVPAAALASTWTSVTIDLTTGTVNGTPVWTALDWAQVQVTETGTSSISIDDLRIYGSTAITEGHVDTSGSALALFPVSFKSAREAIDQLAEHAGKWQWYVDYDRRIHFFPPTSVPSAAPFSLTDTTLNHAEFSAQPDLSQVTNRIYVRGGTERSASQTEEQYGDGVKTTFFLREPPASIGPYLYDVAVYVDTGAGYVSKTYGIANKDDPASYHFLLNADEKYLTNGTHAVLGSTHKLKVTYTYMKPILVRQDDTASQAALAALQPGTDGIYERIITEPSISSTDVARDYALAHLRQYANALVTVSFTTEQEGLHAGQAITVEKTSHNVSGSYLIQRVSRQMVGNEEWAFSVTCASTLFGMIEVLQYLLQRDGAGDAAETVTVLLTASESVTTTDSALALRTSTNFRWATASPASEGAKWNLFSWS